MSKKVIKILKGTTVPISIKILLKNQLKEIANNSFEIYTICGSGVDIDEYLLDQQVKKHFEISLKREINIFSDIKAIIQSVSIIKKVNPDIVHSYTPKAGLILMIAAWIARVPIRIHNITGLPLIEKKGTFRKLLIFLEKIIYFFATDVYVNSTGLKQFIESNISNSEKIKILGAGSTNGIDASFYNLTDNLKQEASEIKSIFKLKDSDFIWIFIGRIVGDKGVNELLNVFEELSLKYPEMKLLLLGQKEEKLDPISEKSNKILENNKNIYQLGFQEDIRPYLAMADCLVFPSYREGLPNVPMQAACFNLPIIATNINGCNEIVQDGINGILIEPKNEISLKNAMLEIYTNVEKRKFFSSTTRKQITSKYEQSKVWDLLINEYHTLLKNYAKKRF